jgi:hypothetical protein
MAGSFFEHKEIAGRFNEKYFCRFYHFGISSENDTFQILNFLWK